MSFASQKVLAIELLKKIVSKEFDIIDYMIMNIILSS